MNEKTGTRKVFKRAARGPRIIERIFKVITQVESKSLILTCSTQSHFC